MNESKFDIGLQALIERGRDRIGTLQLGHPLAQKACAVGAEVLDGVSTPYSKAVDAVQTQGEEAARAAEEVARAEHDAEQDYARLDATFKAELYRRRADPGADADMFERRVRRGLPHTPSDFANLGVDRSASSLASAVEFAAGVLADDDEVLQAVEASLTNLQTKLQTADSEEAERVSAMQKLYAARAEAKRGYSAARNMVEAALMLEGSEEGISQIMPPASSIYGSGAPQPEQPEATDDPVTPEEPVEA